MASYDDLRNVIEHIGDKTGDPDAWQQGLTPQQIRDVNGWLASDGSDYRGYQDPETGVVYEDRSHQNSSVNPAVPDDALDRIRQAHWQLFDPATKAPIAPAPGAPPAHPPAAPDINSPQNTDPGLNNPPAPNPNPPPAGGGLSTDEENSGRAADAIKKVQAEMSGFRHGSRGQCGATRTLRRHRCHHPARRSAAALSPGGAGPGRRLLSRGWYGPIRHHDVAEPPIYAVEVAYG